MCRYIRMYIRIRIRIHLRDRDRNQYCYLRNLIAFCATKECV